MLVTRRGRGRWWRRGWRRRINFHAGVKPRPRARKRIGRDRGRLFVAGGGASSGASVAGGRGLGHMPPARTSKLFVAALLSGAGVRPADRAGPPKTDVRILLAHVTGFTCSPLRLL